MLAEQFRADLKDAMRTGDTGRRDEIRGLLAMLQSETQAKLDRELRVQGLLADAADVELTPEQAARAERLRAESELSEEEARGVLQLRAKQHRQSIEAFQKGNRTD